MDTIHILFRRAQPTINIQEAILGARKAHKIQKQVQQSGDVLQRFNNTIHKAAPLIEYAVDALSARLAKKKESTIDPSLLFETTTFIYKSLEESSTFNNPLKKKSNFYDEIFDKNNWSSQKIIFGILVFSIILILTTLLLTRLFLKKNSNEISHHNKREIDETDSLRRSIDSTVSSLQE